MVAGDEEHCSRSKLSYFLIIKILESMLYTPLEQFQIILLLSIKLFCFDFSITNLALVNILTLLVFGAVITLFSSSRNYLKETSFFFIPSA
jgi:hypothetical protein